MAKLEIVTTEDLDPKPAVSPPAPAKVVAVDAERYLGLVLKVLSQRTVLLGAALMPLAALALLFILTQQVLDNPNTYQLVALAIYGIFALALILVRSKP